MSPCAEAAVVLMVPATPADRSTTRLGYFPGAGPSVTGFFGTLQASCTVLTRLVTKYDPQRPRPFNTVHFLEVFCDSLPLSQFCATRQSDASTSRLTG